MFKRCFSDAEFENLRDLPDEIRRRAKHCMTEHRRTLAAITALRDNDMIKLGHLMTESHASMRDDFENTLPQLDALVEDAVELGALGARMTGGGFGGCIVACVDRDRLETWREHLLKRHKDAFYVC